MVKFEEVVEVILTKQKEYPTFSPATILQILSLQLQLESSTSSVKDISEQMIKENLRPSKDNTLS